jgi:N-acetylmuramoyl-L-alanine amidase
MAPETDPVSALLPLCPGSAGTAVRDLQIRLRQTGLLATAAASGVYDPPTESAVLAFQERSGLETTGTCDQSTWAALVESGYTLGDRLLYQRVPMLRGDDIAVLQRRLSELGFHGGRVDGIFGPETEAAVKAFQRNCALVTDGVAGPDVVAQLRRLGPASGAGTVTKAILTERLQLLDAPHDLSGARIAIGEPGTLPALTHNITRCLDATGAVTLAVHHPDGSAKAAEANRFDAHCFVGCTSRSAPGARLSFYRTEGFESAGGRHLATVVAQHLDAAALAGPITTQGMRLPVLRETRMPALWCELGPPSWIVEHAAEVATAFTAAIAEWLAAPLDDLAGD